MSHDKIEEYDTNRNREQERPSVKEIVARFLAIAAYAATTAAASPGASNKIIDYFRSGDDDQNPQHLEVELYDEYITVTAEADGTRFDVIRQAYPGIGGAQVFEIVRSTINLTAREEGRDDEHEVQKGDQVDVPKIDAIVTD